MTLRIAGLSRIGIAAALTLGVVGSAAAQAASDQRLPVTPKSSSGDVVLRVDTVTVYRTDTLRVFRIDTVRVTNNVPGPTVTNTVTRYDTVTVETVPGWFRRPSGMYFGLGGAPTYAGGSLVDAQAAGYGAQAHIGVDPAGSPLGLRIDALWNRPTGRAPYKGNVRSRATVWNLNGDLKLRLPPLLKNSFPVTFYGIGGGGYAMYKNLLITLDEPTAGTLPGNVANADDKWHDKWSWNYGAGTSVGWGKHELFAEYRFIDFKAANANIANQQAFVVGFNWY